MRFLLEVILYSPNNTRNYCFFLVTAMKLIVLEALNVLRLSLQYISLCINIRPHAIYLYEIKIYTEYF